MPRFLPEETTFLSGFSPAIDPAIVGDEVSVGAQHVVRLYGEGATEVVKYPRAVRRELFAMFMSPLVSPDRKTMREHLEICRKRFGEFVLDTNMYDGNGEGYCLVQPKVQMRPLTYGEYQNAPELETQLSHLVAENRKLLLDKGLWFDFMGWDPKLLARCEPYLSNLGVTGEKGKKRLVMFDFGLYTKGDWSLRGFVDTVLKHAQEWNLRGFRQVLTPRRSKRPPCSAHVLQSGLT